MNYLEIYLGEEAAKEAVFDCPYLLTKNAKNMRESLPALINVLGAQAAHFLWKIAGGRAVSKS